MKEIGEKLKETREEMGISIEEVASDLKISTSQIEDIENGNMDAFKDIFSLKYFIRDYSKYLGLSYEDMVDDFNEYLFDYTSKISIDDIKEAKKKSSKGKEPVKRISSPYTIEHKRTVPVVPIIFITVLVCVLIIVMLVVWNTHKNPPKQGDNSQLITE